MIFSFLFLLFYGLPKKNNSRENTKILDYQLQQERLVLNVN